MTSKLSPHTFNKGERLKSRTILSRLFTEGQSIKQYPLRLIWMPLDKNLSKYPVQFALSVPKRKFKKATQRNPIRRRIREAYRLQKHNIYDQLHDTDPQYAFIVIYMSNEPLSFAVINKAMKGLFDKWLKKRNSQNS